MTEDRRIRGFVGEQSFEIQEGKDLLREFSERMAEAVVYGEVYRGALKKWSNSVIAASDAGTAVLDFRKTRRE